MFPVRKKYLPNTSKCVTGRMRNYGNIYYSVSDCLKASVSSDWRLISVVRTHMAVTGSDAIY